MNDALWIAIIAALPGVLTALLSSRKNGKKIDAIHVDVNSRLSELLEEHGRAERQSGIADERQIGADRAIEVATAANKGQNT